MVVTDHCMQKSQLISYNSSMASAAYKFAAHLKFIFRFSATRSLEGKTAYWLSSGQSCNLNSTLKSLSKTRLTSRERLLFRCILKTAVAVLF